MGSHSLGRSGRFTDRFAALEHGSPGSDPCFFEGRPCGFERVEIKTRLAGGVQNDTLCRQQLLDRISSFTATGVAKAVLELSREIDRSGETLTRQEFRHVMKELNFVAGKSNLAVLSQRQLIGLFRPIFDRQVRARKPMTVMQKLFSGKK
mgnify:CR=1 FL=1